MNFINIKNNQAIDFDLIPLLNYEYFLEFNTELMSDEKNHCVQYFGFRRNDKLRLICCMANDDDGLIKISSSEVELNDKIEYPSFSAKHLSFHVFEREIHENYGLKYSNHQWLKPIRFPFNRANQNSTIANYPFYKIDSEELHEVGVGPIHAGVIEPGHFRFLCNGEQILHLEIQLGFQHRGIEALILQKKNILQQTILAESIAGDTVVGHTVTFAKTIESLCGFIPTYDLQLARTLALEWERIAIHTGDLSAICTDVAYQLGSSVFGRLRTPIINSFQVWCGNRLAKSLIRVGKNQFPFTKQIADYYIKVLKKYEPDFVEMYERTKNLPSVLARLEKTGVVTKKQGLEIGAVGMAARMCNIERDIRKSHQHDFYSNLNHQPIIKKHGDVYSRTQIRYEEVLQSITYVKDLIKDIPNSTLEVDDLKSMNSNKFVLSLTEGWRGEICHCAITDEKGELLIYKIKDPSLHNWLALALAVRNNEISDFPICNKSFNLSYCGNDL